MQDGLAEIAAIVRAAKTPAAVAKKLSGWAKSTSVFEAIGDAIYVPAVLSDLAGQLMVYGREAHTIQLDASNEVTAFLDLPWDEAIAEWKARGLMSPDEFAKMLGDYAQRSAKARELMLEQVQTLVRARLESAIAEGSTFKQFADAIQAGTARLGLSAQDPAYLECLPGGTPVTAAVVTAAHRRWHEGTMVEVVTSNGRKFSATPNHPMLTRAGWRAAGELCEGDDLVGHARKQGFVILGHDDVTAPPPSISEVFDALAIADVVERVDGSPGDFHGDGADRNVDVVRPARVLRIGSFSALRQPIGEYVFAASDTAAPAFCGACGNLVVVTQRCGFCDVPVENASAPKSLADGAVAGLEPNSEFVGALPGNVARGEFVDRDIPARRFASGLPAASEVAGARVAQRAVDAGFSNRDEEYASIEPRLGGDVIDAEAGEIEFDRVVSVSVREFSGHVYNLSTTHGYFTIAGLVTGNTVFRTNVQAAYGAGRFRAMTDPDVVEARPFVEYRTVGDAVVRPSHAILAGTCYHSASPAWHKISPPNGFRCFPAGVVTQGTFETAVRALYSGELVKLCTESGRTLSVTPNHPLLTADGFAVAASVRNGQYVLSYRGGVERLVFGEVDPKNPPAKIEDVFDAFFVRNGAASRLRPVADDFYGDAVHIQGEVDVVSTKSSLLRDLDAKAADERCDAVFAATLARDACEVRGSAQPDLGVGVFPDPGNAPGGSALTFDARSAEFEGGPLEELRLGSAADVHASAYQTTQESGTANPGLVSELLQGHAGDVFLDKVVSVERESFHGYVYDLESPFGWIVANGIFTSNCRCSMVTLSRDEAKGREILGEIPAGGEPDPGFDGPPVARLDA
jgi:hypothetical protein